MKTQQNVILEELKSGRPINQKMAYDLCGSQRLGAIIFNLRKIGYDIMTINTTGINRFGRKTTFAMYHLSNTQEQIKRIENGQS